MFSQLIDFLNNHKVLILGFGREGRSTYDIIRRHLPKKQIGISDIKQIELAKNWRRSLKMWTSTPAMRIFSRLPNASDCALLPDLIFSCLFSALLTS